MAKKRFIDPVALKKALHYDPDTGVFTKLSDSSRRSDYPKGFKYSQRPMWDSYVQIKVDGQYYAAHRLAWVYMTGEQPDIIDHINGLRHDNSWSNLRNGTHRDNCLNKKQHRKKNGTYIPYLGITQGE